MKKLLALLLATVLLITLAACGGEKDVEIDGKWHVEFVEYEGARFTVEEWNEIEDEDFSSCYIVFKDGGKAYLYEDGYGDLVNWLATDEYVMIDDEKAAIIDGEIHLENYYGETLILNKISDSQEIPKEEEEENEESDEEEPDATTTTTATTTTKAPTTTTTTKATSGGLDPDFKKAMDSYESFMNEYVAFMKKYQANPTDLGLLADYADYMGKYADFVTDFEAWNDEDMNAAETAYYLEVQTRVNKKLLEIAG